MVKWIVIMKIQPPECEFRALLRSHRARYYFVVVLLLPYYNLLLDFLRLWLCMMDAVV